MDVSVLYQLLYFFIFLLIAGAIFWAITWFIRMQEIPQPYKTGILFVIGIFGLIWLLVIALPMLTKGGPVGC